MLYNWCIQSFILYLRHSSVAVGLQGAHITNKPTTGDPDVISITWRGQRKAREAAFSSVFRWLKSLSTKNTKFLRTINKHRALNIRVTVNHSGDSFNPVTRGKIRRHLGRTIYDTFVNDDRAFSRRDGSQLDGHARCPRI